MVRAEGKTAFARHFNEPENPVPSRSTSRAVSTPPPDPRNPPVRASKRTSPIGERLKEADKILVEGLQPRVIVEGSHLAKAESLSWMEDLNTPLKNENNFSVSVPRCSLIKLFKRVIVNLTKMLCCASRAMFMRIAHCRDHFAHEPLCWGFSTRERESLWIMAAVVRTYRSR